MSGSPLVHWDVVGSAFVVDVVVVVEVDASKTANGPNEAKSWMNNANAFEVIHALRRVAGIDIVAVEQDLIAKLV